MQEKTPIALGLRSFRVYIYLSFNRAYDATCGFFYHRACCGEVDAYEAFASFAVDGTIVDEHFTVVENLFSDLRASHSGCANVDPCQIGALKGGDVE